MTTYQAPLDDVHFLLYSVFRVESFVEQLQGVEALDGETLTAILAEAKKICEQRLAPLNAVGDAQPATWREGVVFSPPGFKEAYSEFCEDGWGALGGEPEYGGMGLPKSVVAVIEEFIQGANMAFGLAPMLTAGACLLLSSHGSNDLKQRFLPKMLSGEWAGAMDLTEPHCGTDLGRMRTKAVPDADGSYRLSGSKMFITWGDHDLGDNIIHLVLAKLPDAPEGSRGISLFLVPKYRVLEDGQLGGKNGVSCGSIEHKMGIHGSPTCVMNFDEAQGWLVGEAHKGLACMFTMMNYERLVVGIQGVAVAHAAFVRAREYANERLQGRSPILNSGHGPDPIIEHPDVRRMLLQAKSLTEAGRTFYLYVARWLDTARYGKDAATRQRADDRVALLTPVAKAFLTDRAYESCALCQMVLGGHGYVREWGIEQLLRDVRITQIYEGTNGIQALDLAGRKTVASQGRLIEPYIVEMREFLSSAENMDAAAVAPLSEAIEQLELVTSEIVDQPSPTFAASVACDYLDLLGYISYGYMFALNLAALADVADTPFAESKRITAKFYFAKLLPRCASLVTQIRNGAEVICDFDSTLV